MKENNAWILYLYMNKRFPYSFNNQIKLISGRFTININQKTIKTNDKEREIKNKNKKDWNIKYV